MTGYRDIFTENVLKTKDLAYNNLKGIINNNYLVVLKRDKDSSVGIIYKSDYVSKVHKMIDESINNGISQISKLVSKFSL